MKILPVLILLMLLPNTGSFRIGAKGLPLVNHADVTNKLRDSTPIVGFCELVRNADLYFDKQVRVRARYQMATEGRYLSDDNCPLSHDDQIGAGQIVLDEKQRDTLKAQLRSVSTSEYGGRAMVNVLGILRNSSRRDFWWYRYRFDIIRVEDIAPVAVPYEGELQATVSYQASVRADVHGGLALLPALKSREHYATRIEWINLSKFPKLRKLKSQASAQRILFTVLSDEIRQVTQRRWNRTLRCKIVRVN